MPGAVAFYVVLQPFVVRAEIATLICLAAHELLRNTLVHAFPAGAGGHVGVHLWKTFKAEPRAYLVITDDGVGFGDEPPVTAECGLALARRYLGAAGAQLMREPGSGTLWRVSLP